MITLTDLFNLHLFERMKSEGYVSVQGHPEDLDLYIANYTDRAQYDQVWNDVTTQCRGLIFKESTGEIVARPPRKFFNYNEPHAPKIYMNDLVAAYDKLDGSLGIIYPFHGEWRVATRGSFTSKQAIRGQKLLDEMIFHRFDPKQTTVVEIIYPENRIVVNYGSFEGLVYLGDVEIETGEFLYRPEYWTGYDFAEPMFAGTFKELLELPERKGKEGFVVHSLKGDMVKVKYEEYVRLHRLVSNLTKKKVWEAMGEPSLASAQELARQLDEEFSDWVLKTAHELITEYVVINAYVNEVAYRAGASSDRSRKEVALAIKDEPKFIQDCVFKGLDNRSYTSVLWEAIKPKNEEKESY